MKDKILICASIVCFLILSNIGCKKNYQQKEAAGSRTMNLNSISVSSYGFLVFPETADLDEYREFLLSHTHAEVQAYLREIGLRSLGATFYGEEYLSQPVTEEQSVNYIFNEDQVFQVKNAIMRPIDETGEEVKWRFLLVMTPENLFDDSYANLAAGTFDEGTMNKFATNPEDENVDLFDFIIDTPSGYEETVPNSAEARRPFIGKTVEHVKQCGGSHYDPGQEIV